jgi:hypothetical protein
MLAQIFFHFYNKMLLFLTGTSGTLGCFLFKNRSLRGYPSIKKTGSKTGTLSNQKRVPLKN